MTHPRLETERLILRRPAGRDAATVMEFFRTDRAEHVGGQQTVGGAWRNFAAELGHWEILDFGMWAVTLKGDDQIIGLVGAWYPADWPETEIGWLIFDGYEGHGYAYEAAQAAIRHAFETLGWDTAVSYIAPANDRSIALAERLGATLDPDAPQPKPDHPCLIYRHPRPAETGGAS